MINPYSKEYYLQELESYKIPAQKFKSVELKRKNANTKLDGYMYDTWIEQDNIPVFYINHELWMSLTPMEVESHYMPIQLAIGKVGVAGLGMGYYLQRILNQDCVQEVIVYEINQDVIDFYLANFGEHPKLKIKCQNALEIKNEYFDFFYCDIYDTQMDLQAIEDMKTILSNNIIDQYHFWTMEQMFLEMLIEKSIPIINILSWIKTMISGFIEMLIEARGNDIKLRGIGRDIYNEFIKCELIREVS